MFGYIRINKMDMTFREYEHYRAYYCGLCKYLKRNHSEISRLTINYDITFLIILLTSVYIPESEIFYERCIVNPVKKKKHMINGYTEYAAAMNIVLAYYKILDNVDDDGALKDKAAELMYRKSFRTAAGKYPEKTAAVERCLSELHRLEKENSDDIDRVSNTFGELMREIFAYDDDEYGERLGRAGFNIGKYIYIMDAFEDLEKDLKDGSYNPFRGYSENREALVDKVEFLSSTCLAMMEDAIKSLDIKVNNGIIRNIIYSGVYLRFKKAVYEYRNGGKKSPIDEKNMSI